MPLHEYKHLDDAPCKHKEELLLKMSDEVPPFIECPVCGEQLRKQLGAGSFRLRGTGWYHDGYKGGK